MKIVKKILLIPVITIFILIFNACGGKVFYEKVDAILNETWNIDSVLHYEFEITDSMCFYNIYFNIRNSVDFETQNFYVFLISEFPNGTTGQDTLGFKMCDQYGKWTGKGAGRIKDNQFLYKAKVRFPRTGVYKFSAVQGMREDNVCGITDFGMALYYFDKDKL
ncbi:MAG: gliding motility lipoprotein GldH [Bacteroidales bacterium]|jgi:gliding motility-associated lipoprotein GldH|nr:gliding motility lipoprotein GldH [Bacteroidales bacterium]